MGAQVKTTVWIAADDRPDITREDHCILIEVPGDHTIEIFLDPSLFPRLRELLSAPWALGTERRTVDIPT